MYTTQKFNKAEIVMNKKYLFSLLASSLLMSGNLSAAEVETLINSNNSQNVQLSIYNDNLAFVRDTRKVNLTEGENKIAFEGVSSQIRPETAMLWGANVKVLEQNYDYNLMTPENILNNSVGKQVKTALYNEQSGETVYDTAQIIDTSTYGRPVLKFAYGIETNFPGRIIFEEIPSGLRNKPTLVVDLKSDSAQKDKDLELAYLTSGLSWKADYVADLRKSDTLSLNGWVTLQNNSGIDYNNAQVQLIAGQVRQVAPIAPRMLNASLYKASAGMAMDAVAESGAMPTQEALSDYYLYTLPSTTTLKNQQTKQVSLMEKKKVKYTKEYKLRSPLYLGGMTREAEFEKANPEVVYVLHNTQANGLGEAMPKGTIRFFENDKSGQMQFIGESNLSQLAIGEKAELSLGTTSDIYAHGKTTVGTKISDDISEVSAEITFNNAKSEAVEVEFTQNFSGISWDMISESIKSEKKNISTAVWKVSVPANGSETLRFKVRLNKKA